VLKILRAPDGGPALPVKLLAGLVVLGLIALTVPLFLAPLLRFVLGIF
jgi:hypothetical protein